MGFYFRMIFDHELNSYKTSYYNPKIIIVVIMLEYEMSL